MKKYFLFLIVIVLTTASKGQTAWEFLTSKKMNIVWFGVDYSHVKLVGDFNQFIRHDMKPRGQLGKAHYFYWNKAIEHNKAKYNIAGMLRKDNCSYETDMINELNAVPQNMDMRWPNDPDFSKEKIRKFVLNYNYKAREAIGIVLLAESLNERDRRGVYHFVAINMKTKEVVFQHRILAAPDGTTFNTYWEGSLYRAIKDIEKYHYKIWVRMTK